MAEFLAYRIMCGKLKLDDVPARLRDKVDTILRESGYYSTEN
jgi:hypothetical protein